MSILKLIKFQVIPDIKSIVLSNLIKYFKKDMKFLGKIGFSKLDNPHFFIHLPKCAGNSIKKYLKDNNFPTIILGHSTFYPFYKFPYEVSKSNNPNAFCVVRNPFERIVSAYFFLRKGGMNFMDEKTYNKYLSEYEDFQDFILNGLGNNKNCKTLIEKVIHLIPQTNFLINKDGELCVAKKNLIHLENFKKEFETYLHSLGKEYKELPWENKSCERRNYKDEYKNNEMIDIVSEVYDKDFNELGYSRRIVKI